MKRTKHTPRNWDSMTKAQKRVAVAKDVLKQIEARRVRMVQGEYVVRGGLRSSCPPLDTPDPQYSDISEHMSCTACALGAAVLSLIRFENDCTVDEIPSGGLSIRDWMAGVFPTPQLDLMESAYERVAVFRAEVTAWWYDDNRLIDSIEHTTPEGHNVYFQALPKARQRALRAAVEFGRAFHDAEDRAVAIFQNVIDHGGTFKPRVEYEVCEVTA